MNVINAKLIVISAPYTKFVLNALIAPITAYRTEFVYPLAQSQILVIIHLAMHPVKHVLEVSRTSVFPA